MWWSTVDMWSTIDFVKSWIWVLITYKYCWNQSKIVYKKVTSLKLPTNANKFIYIYFLAHLRIVLSDMTDINSCTKLAMMYIIFTSFCWHNRFKRLRYAVEWEQLMFILTFKTSSSLTFNLQYIIVDNHH